MTLNLHRRASIAFVAATALLACGGTTHDTSDAGGEAQAPFDSGVALDAPVDVAIDVAVDMVVHHHALRATIANLCRVLSKAPAAPPAPSRSPLAALPAPAEE